jgi:hypothetical protein
LAHTKIQYVHYYLFTVDSALESQNIIAIVAYNPGGGVDSVFIVALSSRYDEHIVRAIVHVGHASEPAVIFPVFTIVDRALAPCIRSPQGAYVGDRKANLAKVAVEAVSSRQFGYDVIIQSSKIQFVVVEPLFSRGLDHSSYFIGIYANVFATR